jgi:hypothetical protein
MQEYDAYIDSVERMEAAHIIDEEYKITIFYELVRGFNPETSDLTTTQLKAILSLENPLWTLFDEWMNRDNISQMEIIIDTIKETADQRAIESGEYEIAADPCGLDEEAEDEHEP